MNDYLFNLKLGEMASVINSVKEDLAILKKTIKPENDLWDGNDVIRNWKISERTLAGWREKKMIGYIQINKKIYYPREAREIFLSNHFSEGRSNHEN